LDIISDQAFDGSAFQYTCRPVPAFRPKLKGSINRWEFSNPPSSHYVDLKLSIIKMKFIVAVLLFSLTAANPVHNVINGVIAGSMAARIAERDNDCPVETGKTATNCNADNVLRALRGTKCAPTASPFCSIFIGKTAITTVSTLFPVTDIVTVTSTTTVETTITIEDVTTSMILCAASPTAAVTTCNYPAYGFSFYLISSTPNTDPVTCHEKCLQDPNCKSFQVQSGALQYCSLYNVPTSGNVQYAPSDVFTFFDRDCSQYLPPGCGGSPAKVKRTITSRPSCVPTVCDSRLSSACSCLLGGIPTTTVTNFVPSTSVVTQTVSQTP
jgi:hypothetical protein